VIEASKAGFEEQWVQRIADCVDPGEITHIFLNHTEPDHAGALGALLTLAPGAKVYASRAANMNIAQILNADFPGVVIKGGDNFDLGGVTLQVIDAPFLHWPDSLFLWCEEMNALFTCDMFGFHYAADEVFVSNVEEDMLAYRRYYYDAIFSPFSEYVLSALEKIDDKSIDYLLTSHGPIYRTKDEAKAAIDLYRAWAKETVDAYEKDAVFIGYASSYGYTRAASEQIADVMRQNGLRPVVYNIGAMPGKAAAAAARCAGIVVGTSTLNRDALPPIWGFLAELSAIRLRNRPAFAYGSFGWSGEAVANVEARLKQLGLKVQDGVKWKLKPTEVDLATVREAAQKLAEAVKAAK
jgi:flavorubredoxin